MSDPLSSVLSRDYPNVGAEKATKCGNHCVKLTDQHGSVRYILDDGTKPIAAIQLMVKGKSAIIANIYVDPEYRRNGIATTLVELTKNDYPNIQYSENVTEDGKPFETSLKSKNLIA